MHSEISTPAPTPPTCGVVYSVTGKKFRREAEVSARTVRAHMPELPITIYTDSDDFPPGLFDQVLIIDQPNFAVVEK